jgi:hypothetical protein
MASARKYRVVGAWFVFVGVVLGIDSGRGWANAPAPMRPERELPQARAVQVGESARFVIRRDANEEHSRIIVPRKLLPAQPAASRLSLSGPQGKAVNVGLMLAVMLGGGGLTVVFARRRRVGAAAGVMVVTLALVVACCTAMASAAWLLPQEANLPNAATVPPGAQVAVEIVESGSTVFLILGKDAPQVGP